MSSTDVRPIHSVGDRADYLECGVGEMKREHAAAGTDRLAVMFCSVGTIDEFVERGEALAEKHGRQVQAQGYLQNFEKHEFDVNNPDALQRVNDLGYMLVQRMDEAEGVETDVLVVTHADADGGHAHNHIIRLNHDNLSGKGIRKFRTHGSVKKVNDALMREQGLRTVDDRRREIALGLKPGQVEAQARELVGAAGLEQRLQRSIRTTQATYWAGKRGDLVEGEKPFDVFIGDAVAASMLDPDVTNDDALAEALGKIEVPGAPDDKHDGITMVVDPKHGGTKFRMWNEKTGRYNYRSAAKLSPEFTSDGRQHFFDEKAVVLKKQAEQQAREAEAQREAEAERVEAERLQREADERVEAERLEVERQEAARAEQAKVEMEARVQRQMALDAQREQWRNGELRFEELDPEAQRHQAAIVAAGEVPESTWDRLSATEITRRVDAAQARLLEAEQEKAQPSAPAAAEPAVSSAPAAAEPAVSSAPAAEPAAFRSQFHDVKMTDPKAQKVVEQYAMFEEVAVAKLERGERPTEQDVKRLGVGPKFLEKFGDRMEPSVREPLKRRAAMLAERRQEFEERGKPLKERLDALKARGQAPSTNLERLVVGYRPTEIDRVQRDLQASNRKVASLEKQVEAGDYWDDPRTVGAAGGTKKTPAAERTALEEFNERMAERGGATGRDVDELEM